MAQIKATEVTVNNFIFTFFFQYLSFRPKKPQHQTHTLAHHHPVLDAWSFPQNQEEAWWWEVSLPPARGFALPAWIK